MSTYSSSDYEVVKACYQLQLYLSTLNLPFTVRSLYEKAYKSRLGVDYDPTFLLDLQNDTRFISAKDEPYTTQTIIETLLQYGHEPLVRTLLKETKKLNVGFTQAYIMGFNRKSTLDQMDQNNNDDDLS